MSPDMRKKPTHRILANIEHRGLKAFKEGELVVVEEISPDPVSPNYKYVVHSKGVGRSMRLSDSDIAPIDQTASQVQLPGKQKFCANCGETIGEEKFCTNCGAGVPAGAQGGKKHMARRQKVPVQRGRYNEVSAKARETLSPWSGNTKIWSAVGVGVAVLIIVGIIVGVVVSGNRREETKRQEAQEISDQIDRDRDAALDACMADRTWVVVENMTQHAGDPDIYVSPLYDSQDTWVVNVEFSAINGVFTYEWLVYMGSGYPEVSYRGEVY